MSDIPARLRAEVVDRAGGRCEYCRLSQVGQEARFHVDHIVPRAAGGTSILDNLALACVSCSLRKGARQSAIDPQSGLEVPLFHPRTDSWPTHFQWNEDHLEAITATGRATATLMALNRPLIVAIRREEILRGRHPPE